VRRNGAPKAYSTTYLGDGDDAEIFDDMFSTPQGRTTMGRRNQWE
jgi:hypothetical protein